MTAAVAAILLLKEEELIGHLRTHGAVSKETAMTPDALSISQDITFRRLRDRAVIREGARGTFYLDEETVSARKRIRGRMNVIVLSIAVILLIAAVALFMQTNRGAAS